VYQATIEGDDAESRQNAAMINLFHEVMIRSLSMDKTTSTTAAEAEEKYRKACDMADTLLRGSVNGYAHADRWIYRADEEILRSAAMIYRKRGAEIYEREMKFATANKTRHGRERAVVIGIGDTTQRLFGKKRYGIVAKLATVATGREIARSTVQKCWLPPPVYKNVLKKRKVDTD
jgi:hypothetical protein